MEEETTTLSHATGGRTRPLHSGRRRNQTLATKTAQRGLGGGSGGGGGGCNFTHQRLGGGGGSRVVVVAVVGAGGDGGGGGATEHCGAHGSRATLTQRTAGHHTIGL